ncbi:tyrosine-type recombinase/integrase [Methanococcus maripaludis]|uniref:Site-specific recombinase XerD n=1 Tax=Methanococcus maripaludis TaxID=39152 RepID=A0A7J9PTS5_METMI|nr:tyrosine-type recombinase/integrase [Methanococcus maripaludis]MBA2869432.1 site-specific recombinase XerD [Methanococcus maripaludis]
MQNENAFLNALSSLFSSIYFKNIIRLKIYFFAKKKQIKKLQIREVIPPNMGLVIHSLRHGRAIDFLEKEMPIEIVKEYLGHASLETILFYTHSQERKSKMLNNFKIGIF